ncbi:MAG: hypothetical protein M1828_007402 [Chrysothrix sp. TS-e1954]|nr:MAG: hypothetical protein M1828_007402 [Chrysothrix sp. TS-e1954]
MADETANRKKTAEEQIPRFRFQRLLNQDQAGRRISLLGTIDAQPAILLAERAAFSTDSTHLASFAQSLGQVSNLGANDIYSWFLASTNNTDNGPSDGQIRDKAPSDLKLNVIYPCTEQHIAKYSAQGVRTVTETPQIYSEHVRPFMKSKRDAGRLNWVFNIIEGRTEQEDVIFREHTSGTGGGDDGFLLLPDLNWDRKTITSLHLLGIVERRDVWSVRDLTKRHIPWLENMRKRLVDSITRLYPQVEADQLKLYVHYQPTYYHFHVHVVHVMAEAGTTQAVGKALGLENIIDQLGLMKGDEDVGMRDVSLTYGLGEASELWTEIFGSLKAGKLK